MRLGESGITESLCFTLVIIIMKKQDAGIQMEDLQSEVYIIVSPTVVKNAAGLTSVLFTYPQCMTSLDLVPRLSRKMGAWYIHHVHAR